MEDLEDCLCYKIRPWVLDEMRWLEDDGFQKKVLTPQLGAKCFAVARREKARLRAEIFARLYDPVETEAHRLPKILPEHQWAEVVHQKIAMTEDWPELQRLTAGQSVDALIAARRIVDRAIQDLGSALSNAPPEAAPCINADPKDLREAFLLFNSTGDREAAAKVAEFGKQVTAFWKELADEMRPGCPASSPYQTRNFNGVVGTALKEVGDLLQFQKACPSLDSRPPELDKNNLAAALNLAKSLEKMSGKGGALFKILDLAGRIEAFARKKRPSSSKDDGIAIKGVRVGGPICNSLPQEIAYLGIPDFADGTLARIADRSQLSFRLGGKRSMRRGPLVIAIDVSGSMAAGMGQYRRIEWQAALLFTMLRLAREEKRHAVVLPYHDAVTSRADLPRHLSDLAWQEAVASLLSITPDKGTSWESAMNASIRALERDRALKKADVIFLTDGEDSFGDYWIEKAWEPARRSIDFSCYFIAIASELSDNAEASVQKVADKIFTTNSSHVSDLASIEEIFSAI